ncbi:MAG: ABC transporter ATP-binding protein [Magnetococcales bacterium]|nr:ABC transporter ATP-binding protein [Magnetococcales bacterium]
MTDSEAARAVDIIAGQDGEQPVLLEAQALVKSFKTPAQTLTVLHSVDLTLKRGEMVGLLGVSGVGKSTLIQILGGLDHPTSGKVLLDGASIFDLSERKRAALRNRRVGFIYQSHRLLPEFSALENVAIPLMIGRMSRRKAMDRARSALNDVGLEKRADHKPGQLSGGEQQRVAIARAMVTEPDLLLADEPTGNLDQKTARNVFDMMLDLNQRHHLSCLMVTHNPELANDLDRQLFLDRGTLRPATEAETQAEG